MDASTGELMYFGYALDAPPYVTYGVLDATGAKVHTTPIPIRKPQMMHDFAIAGGAFTYKRRALPASRSFSFHFIYLFS